MMAPTIVFQSLGNQVADTLMNKFRLAYRDKVDVGQFRSGLDKNIAIVKKYFPHSLDIVAGILDLLQATIGNTMKK